MQHTELQLPGDQLHKDINSYDIASALDYQPNNFSHLVMPFARNYSDVRKCKGSMFYLVDNGTQHWLSC